MPRLPWLVLPKLRLQGWLKALLVMGTLAVVWTDVANLIAAHDRTIRVAQGETVNLSRSLAEHAHGVFQSMDTILVGLRERVETDGTGPAALQRLEKVMQLRVEALPLVHRLMVVDEKGRVLVASAGDAHGAAPVNVSDRPIFQHHATVADRSAFLGWPIKDHFDGTIVLPISRRVNHADGSFAGVVLASVSAELFQHAYTGYDTGHEGVVLLVRDDGIAMARWPADPLGAARNLANGPLFQHVVPHENRSRFQYTSAADGTVRFGSYARVPGGPALVLVGRGRHEGLAAWHAQAVAHAAGLCVFLGLIALLGHRLVGQIGAVERTQRFLTETNHRLAASEERTRRAKAWLDMAEQVAQVGHWHIAFGGPGRSVTGDSNRVFWSDELYRIYGVDSRRLQPGPQTTLACYHPEDRPFVLEAMEASVRNAMPFEFKSRLLRPDGSVRHVLNRGLPDLDGDGAVMGCFGVVMDITEQKGSEDALQSAHAKAETANRALEAANRALETLVLQDSLTALDNRRCFDRALEAAFRREGRNASPLALIMIDVDCFKQYNDIYGHQAGDECLRSIAAIIPPLLRRPDDTAARYGGEEIAILLPGSAEDRALAVAGSIVACVRALGIPHSGSPHGVVTISAGVGSFAPSREVMSAAELVRQADVALYAAKRAGRNGVSRFAKMRSVETAGAQA